MFNRILTPTDGSEAAAPAVDMGPNMAQVHDAILHVIYIIEETSPGAYGPASRQDHVGGERDGRRVVNDIETEATESGVETVPAVQRGAPRDDILAYANDHDIDLIVMGTHGRTGVKRALVGSVTETVVRHADIPVLTVRAH